MPDQNDRSKASAYFPRMTQEDLDRIYEDIATKIGGDVPDDLILQVIDGVPEVQKHRSWIAYMPNTLMFGWHLLSRRERAIVIGICNHAGWEMHGKICFDPSELTNKTIENIRRVGETEAECVTRILETLAASSESFDHFYGEPTDGKGASGTYQDDDDK